MKIIIVGGGTAGLIAALTLKSRFNNFNINIIKSDKIGIVGVGEGTTEHWREFCEFNKISISELIKETDATFKYGIMFENWTNHTYFHNVEYHLSKLKFGQYLSGFGYCIKNKLQSKEYTDKSCWDNKISLTDLPNQFHFNTYKLNEYLLNKCKSRGIKIFEDEINNIINDEEGNIKYIEGNLKYNADFFIDCTGFKKKLITSLGATWISYKKYLPMNEAIAFPTEDTDEYTPYTLAKAMKAGWMWRIPTNGRWGNGYVFNNNYISAAEAQLECEHYLNKKITIGKNIKFEAGYVDKVWIKNCVAIGLSSSFIEPLEASSIGTSIAQSFLLMHLIVNYSASDINLYNKKFIEIVENIRDFVLLHYLCKKNDSPFWKNFKPCLPLSLINKLDKWKYRLPIQEDFENNYLLFTQENFTIILKELELFDLKYIEKEYESLSENLKNYTEAQMRNFHLKPIKSISHKKYLNNINDPSTQY